MIALRPVLFVVGMLICALGVAMLSSSRGASSHGRRARKRLRTTAFKNVRDTVIAENMLTMTPMASVIAKPLIAAWPNWSPNQ